jgi:SMI1 / KNR4 family (SUKH-1)
VTRVTSNVAATPFADVLRRWTWQPIDPLTRRDPTESDLQWLEEEIAATLPPEYRLFLRTHGWCRFAEAMIFPLRDPAPWGARAKIASFFGFSSEIRHDLAFLVTEGFADTLPEGTIPIGSDAGGNLVLLGIAGAARDRVWFWDRECRGLDEIIDEMVQDLEAEGQDIVDEDENQILRRWEALFPDRRTRPLGFTNVYGVADSFAAFVESLRAAHS